MTVLGEVETAAGVLPVLRGGPEHVPAIVRLLADDPLGRTRETDPGHAAYRRAFEAIDADPNQVLLVLASQDVGVLPQDVGVLATAQVTFIPGLSHSGAWRAQLEGVRVAPQRRGAGVGGAFVEWIADYARQRGASMLQLTTNRQRTDAVRFYERLGFTLSHHGLKLTL